MKSYINYPSDEQYRINDRKERIKTNREPEKLSDKRLTKMFRLTENFDIIIPENYNHNIQLIKSIKKFNEYCYDKIITDEDFSKVSHKLIPGKNYSIKLFDIKDYNVLASDCLNLYNSNNAYFTGAQGLSIMLEQRKDLSNFSKWNQL